MAGSENELAAVPLNRRGLTSPSTTRVTPHGYADRRSLDWLDWPLFP